MKTVLDKRDVESYIYEGFITFSYRYREENLTNLQSKRKTVGLFALRSNRPPRHAYRNYDHPLIPVTGEPSQTPTKFI